MGELVDDAIVDVENSFRRLRENNALENPRPSIQVVYDASREIRSAIVFGTIVVILVFLPLFAISGVSGRLFEPLGVAYIVSILSSLLVSLTLTPVLSYYLLPTSGATHREVDGLVAEGTQGLCYAVGANKYGNTLDRCCFLRGLSSRSLGFCSPTWEAAFSPDFDEGSVQVNVTLPPGSSLEASNLVSSTIDAKFRSLQVKPENPDAPIKYFVRRTGRAEMDEHASPVNFGEYILNMNPAARLRRDEIIKKLLEELKQEVPGVDIEVEQPLAHLIQPYGFWRLCSDSGKDFW